MGSHLGTTYVLKNFEGYIVFEGTIRQIENFLRIDKEKIIKAIYSDGFIKGYQIISVFDNNQIKEKQITRQEHLFNEDGSRRYQYRHGYPNRYKDSHSVRFTPL